MKSLRPIVLAATLVFALTAGVFFALRPRAPVYQGRTLSAWLADLQKGRDGLEHEQAVAAIQALGTNALSLIAERLYYEDSAFRWGLHQQLMHLKWQRFVPLWQDDYSEQAVQAVRSLGPVAAPLVPEAARRLNDPGHFHTAAMALGAIGNETGRRALVTAGASTNRLNRAFAADALDYGPPTNLVREAFLKLLTDAEADVRRLALGSLGRSQRHKPEAAELLAGFAQDPANGGERVLAIRGLGLVGAATTNVVPVLKRLMDDPDGTVANAAADALNRIYMDARFHPPTTEAK